MASLTHWHILGAGSIGCLWAAYLAKAGHPVTLVTRQAGAQAHHANLLLLQQGQRVAIPAGLCTTAVASNIDNLLICVKAHQTAGAIDDIRHAVNDNARVVLLQNGMGNAPLLHSGFLTQRLYLASTTEAACKRGELEVEHTGHGETRIAAIQGADANLTASMQCALPLLYDDAIEQTLWHKLVINCCINPLTVEHQCLNGELASIPAAIESIENITAECALVAAAEGIPQTTTIKQVMDVITKTARNTSSMLQDVQARRQTEIQHMNGYIVDKARQHGIEVPENSRLLRLVRHIQR